MRQGRGSDEGGGALALRAYHRCIGRPLPPPERCAGDVVGHGRKTGSCTKSSLGWADRDAAVHGRLDAPRDEPRHAAPGGQHQLRHPRRRVTAVGARQRPAPPAVPQRLSPTDTKRDRRPPEGAGSCCSRVIGLRRAGDQPSADSVWNTTPTVSCSTVEIPTDAATDGQLPSARPTSRTISRARPSDRP